MGSLTSIFDREPQTIAEAKAEIVETLEQIQEHYAAINRMRLEDRAKWKFFNQKVEELEVVKARALKQERKRLRDNERAKERDELEAKTFSKEFVITPYGFKKEPIKYPNLQQQREQAKEAEKKPKEAVAPQHQQSGAQATAGEGKDPVRRSKSRKSAEQEKPAKKRESESRSGSGSGTAQSGVKGSESEELFVQIDKPANPKKDLGAHVNAAIQKAKVVAVPMVLEEDSGSHSSEELHRTSRKDAAKSKPSQPTAGPAVGKGKR